VDSFHRRKWLALDTRLSKENFARKYPPPKLTQKLEDSIWNISAIQIQKKNLEFKIPPFCSVITLFISHSFSSLIFL
jgi:hypothetical protein